MIQKNYWSKNDVKSHEQKRNETTKREKIETEE